MEELIIIVNIDSKNLEFELNIRKNEKQIIEVYIEEEKKIPFEKKEFGEKLFEILLEEEIINHEKKIHYIFELYDIVESDYNYLKEYLDSNNITKYTLKRLKKGR